MHFCIYLQLTIQTLQHYLNRLSALPRVCLKPFYISDLLNINNNIVINTNSYIDSFNDSSDANGDKISFNIKRTVFYSA